MERLLQVKSFQSLGALWTRTGRPGTAILARRMTQAFGLVAMIALGACGLLRQEPPADRAISLGPDAVVSYILVDAETGDVLVGQSPDRPMMPASTAKVATMVAALELLGPDYRFQTRVLATDRPGDQGVLNGDLILAGGGDPLLTPQDLLGLAQRLKDLGLARVDGRFLYDETVLPVLPAINPAQPAEARYNPGISALSVDFNRWRLLWRSNAGEADTGPDIQRLPPLNIHRVTIGTDPQGPGRDVLWTEDGWRLGADAPKAGDRFLPVRNPGLATAELFRRLARQIGIDLPPPQSGAAPDDANLTARIFSQPLAEIARLGLEHSNNLLSELVGLSAARLYLVRPDNLLTSSAVLSAWLQRAIAASGAKIDWADWDLPNHSGLSRQARVTARQMAGVLRFAHDRRYGGWPFQSFLPTAGFRKAFRDRYLTENASARIWAKTGTMHYAKGLTGYISGQDGRSQAFALFIFDPKARKAYDALSRAERDAPAEQNRALAWIEAAEQAEQEIVLEWLTRH